MERLGFGLSAPEYPPVASGPTPGGQGPCGPARANVGARAADTDRLAAAATAAQERLRDARRRHAQMTRLRDADARVRDRRAMNEEKNGARADYRAKVNRATDASAIEGAAAVWLRQLDQLNRQARVADDRADALANQLSDLERSLPGLELAADAARIAAEAAQVAGIEARRALAACEEQAQRGGGRPQSGPVTASGTPPPWVRHGHPQASPAPAAPDAPAGPAGRAASAVTPPGPPIFGRAQAGAAAAALMRGDRQTMLTLSLRLAEETGLEAGRLQLLLVELREQLAARALDAGSVAFPQGHPFWGQFTLDGARCVVTSLASMGFRFDGQAEWTDGRAPQVRDLALALSYCGFDPRTLRRPAGQAALDSLWHGATLHAEEYLLSQAPDLTPTQLAGLLGPRGGRLAELWEVWARLRPLLARAGGLPG